MKLFFLGLAKTPVPATLAALCRPPTIDSVPGLLHAECWVGPQVLASDSEHPAMSFLRRLLFVRAKCFRQIGILLVSRECREPSTHKRVVRVFCPERTHPVAYTDAVRNFRRDV